MVGEGGHLAVEGEGLEAGLGVVVGDEAVEEAGAGGVGEGVEHGPPVERSDEAAGERGEESGAGFGARKVVVVGECGVGLANCLAGRDYLVSPFFNQDDKPARTALEVSPRLLRDQSDQDRGVNAVALGHVLAPDHRGICGCRRVGCRV